MENVNVDLISNGQAMGEVASRLSSYGRLDPSYMRPFIGDDGRTYVTTCKGDPKVPANYIAIPINTNGTLRRDEWKQLDEVLVRFKDYRLGGIEDLRSNGLVYNLGNAMGTTVMEWHDVSDVNLVPELTMDAVTRAKGDRPVYKYHYMPIPILHVDYEINARELATSRNMGNPLDTTLAERAVRRINERLEDMLFTNLTFSYGEKDSSNQNSIWSYVNHPDRNLLDLGTSWTDSSVTGKDIVDQVISWKQEGINNRFYGPWQFYIPTAYETLLDEDYVGSTPDTAPNTTIRARLMQIAGVKGFKVIDTLAADTIIMVQLTSDVVRLVNGMGLTNVEWGAEGNFITKFKVLTIQVPQIRSDAEGRCGVFHINIGGK
jgi:hypothetical protein